MIEMTENLSSQKWFILPFTKLIYQISYFRINCFFAQKKIANQFFCNKRGHLINVLYEKH